MNERDQAVDAWLVAHRAYHDASAAYNSRLLFVRAERERGSWSLDVTAEYRALNDAQSAALRASDSLYRTLISIEAAPAPDRIAALKSRIDSSLDSALAVMKPNYDDSIAGFNEAWDIVRRKFDEAAS